MQWDLLIKFSAASSMAMRQRRAGRKGPGIVVLRSKDKPSKGVRGWISRCVGKGLLCIDDHHRLEAEHWIQKSIQKYQKNATRFSG